MRQTEDINQVATQCAHCGDDCNSTTIEALDKVFCCHGCKTVYAILAEHDLDQFYTIDSNAGLSQQDKIENDYSYLTDVNIVASLINHEQDDVTTIWLSLPTIHCSSCLWLLENLTRIHQGIQRCTVNFLEKKALIQYDNTVTDLRSIILLLDQIGYPPSITLQDLESQEKVLDRTTTYRLGVAGFCFGNIMLLSFPEYFGLTGVDTTLASYLHLLNFILVLPVMLYSARDYYISAWHGVKNGNLNIDVPIVIGVIALFTKSVIDILQGMSPGYFDSIAGLIFFLLIGKWMQTITYRQIQFDLDYKSYFPIIATKITNFAEEQISLNHIAIGDQLKVRSGELIASDGILINGDALVDYSFVTGESDPVQVTHGSKVYCGGRLQSSTAHVEVTKTVDTSYLTQLWNNEAFDKSDYIGNITNINSWVSKYFTLAIILLSAGAFSYHYWVSDLESATHIFISVLIVACPCAVALAVPFTFGNLIRMLGIRGIFVKNTKVIEQLASIDTIVFDKTGTLTQPTVSKLHYIGRPLTNDEESLVSTLVCQSAHPISRSIAKYYNSKQSHDLTGFVEEVGRGIQAEVSGYSIKVGSETFLANADFLTFKKTHPNQSCNVYICINDRVVGGFVKQSRFHNYLNEMLNRLQSNYRLSVLSGDKNSDANALLEINDQWDALDFEQTPFDKLSKITTLQDRGQQVCMVGDGLNDSGALQKSHVGIGVIENTGGFTPACDIVIQVEDLHHLPDLLTIARKAMKLIYINYFLAIAYNIIGLLFAVQGLLSPLVAAILMPLSSITIVLIGVGSSLWIVKRELK